MRSVILKRFFGMLFVSMLIIAAEALMADGSSAVSQWPSARGNDENNAVVDYALPVKQSETEPAWVRQFSASVEGMAMWQFSPNTPIIVDGYVITTSDKKILKIDADTGKTVKSGDISARANWGYTPITYAELSDGTGMYFCPLAGGVIEGVKETADGFERVWTFKAAQKNDDGTYRWGLVPERDKKEGEEVKPELLTEDNHVLVKNAAHQSLCPIVYSDGIVYTGFFAGSYDYYDYYVAIAAEDITIPDPETGIDREYKAGELVWKYKSKGGFYWNGGVVIGDALITGTQDGVNNNDVTGVMSTVKADSRIMAFDLKTGAVISNILLENAGDICSSVVWDKNDSGRIYWSSCTGMIHSAEVDNATGKIKSVLSRSLTGEQSLTVNTPVVYDGKIYLGLKPKKGAYGYFAAYDADTLDIIFSVPLRGYPKGSPLLTTAYSAEGTGASDAGYLYAYTAYYEEPGGVQVIRFRADATDQESSEVQASNLFDANGYEQYGAGSVIADDKGRLYYKNDSNSIFAIRKCAPVKLAIVGGLKLKTSGRSVTASFNKVSKATGYRILYSLDDTDSWKVVTSKTNSCKFTVPNSSKVYVKVRAEHIDAAKKVYGEYSAIPVTYAAKSTIKKLTPIKKGFIVKYDKHKKSAGYQVQYSLKKTMKKAKTVKITKMSKISLKVKKLKPKKKYFVRVRSVKKLNGKLYYGAWSAVKKVKTK